MNFRALFFHFPLHSFSIQKFNPNTLINDWPPKIKIDSNLKLFNDQTQKWNKTHYLPRRPSIIIIFLSFKLHCSQNKLVPPCIYFSLFLFLSLCMYISSWILSDSDTASWQQAAGKETQTPLLHPQKLRKEAHQKINFEHFIKSCKSESKQVKQIMNVKVNQKA